MGRNIFLGGWLIGAFVGGSACALSLAFGSLEAFAFSVICTVAFVAISAGVGALVHWACGDDEPLLKPASKCRSRKPPRTHNVRIDHLDVRP